MVIFDIIVEAISAVLFRKKKKKVSGNSDGQCPSCGTPVFLTDDERKNGRFICKKCNSLIETTQLK